MMGILTGFTICYTFSVSSGLGVSYTSVNTVRIFGFQLERGLRGKFSFAIQVKREMTVNSASVFLVIFHPIQ